MMRALNYAVGILSFAGLVIAFFEHNQMWMVFLGFAAVINLQFALSNKEDE